MANRDRNKRSARQARQRERAAQEERQNVAQANNQAASTKASVTKSSKDALAKGNKGGFLSRPRAYLSNVRTEMHRVVWPSRNELVNYSVAVIVMLAIFGVLVWAVDTGFVALLVAFTGLRG